MSKQARIEELDDNLDVFDDDTDLPLPTVGDAQVIRTRRDEEDVDVEMEMPRASVNASGAFDGLPQQASMSLSGSASESEVKYLKNEGQFKHFQLLYPVYFDKTRTLAEGRRVPLQRAVENPLAKGIADACRSLGLNVIFEVSAFQDRADIIKPTKMHPQDWANPGRVRVELRDTEGKTRLASIPNSKFPGCV